METPTPLPCTFPGTIVPWNNAPALYVAGKKRGQAGKPSRLLSHRPALASQAEAWETQRKGLGQEADIQGRTQAHDRP